MPRAVARSATLGLLALAVASFACSGGGQGDSHPAVQGSLRGSAHSLAELNDRTRTVAAPQATEVLQVSGVRVTWIDTFDETGTGQVGDVFVQDLFAPGDSFGRGYEGMLLFQPGYSPPSFRATTGDVLDLNGQYSEFQVPKQAYLDKIWRTPEMKGATLSLRLDAAGAQTSPVAMPFADMLLYQTGRRWLSMLVTVENVVVQPCGGSSCVGVFAVSGGRASANLTDTMATVVPKTTPDGTKVLGQPGITNELMDVTKIPLQPGQTIKRLTGLVTLFDRFHVAPRTADDFEL
jgi:hypothetical protein